MHFAWPITLQVINFLIQQPDFATTLKRIGLTGAMCDWQDANLVSIGLFIRTQ